MNAFRNEVDGRIEETEATETTETEATEDTGQDQHGDTKTRSFIGVMCESHRPAAIVGEHGPVPGPVAVICCQLRVR